MGAKWACLILGNQQETEALVGGPYFEARVCLFSDPKAAGEDRTPPKGP